MTNKDHVIQATDAICHALQALARINFANPKQTMTNIKGAREEMDRACESLKAAYLLTLNTELDKPLPKPEDYRERETDG